MTLSKLLKSTRLRQGHSLRGAAEGSGVSDSMISQIESKKRPNPGFFIVMRLAKFYRISPLAIASVRE